MFNRNIANLFDINPLQTLKQISQCEIIISSALHRLIADEFFFLN